MAKALGGRGRRRTAGRPERAKIDTGLSSVLPASYPSKDRPPRASRGGVLAAALLFVLTSIACGANPAPVGVLTFKGAFAAGVAPWTAAGGGAQCADYATPSTPPRLRGDFSTVRVAGLVAGRFDLPRSQPPVFPLQACELTHTRPLELGADDYYGYMFYVPQGWQTGASAFWGVAIAQFHFQGIWGSPIDFELHADHLTLALETGPCNSYKTLDPGCRWRSNADNPNGRPGNLAPAYAVPAPMQKGVWHQIIMHVHWATDSSGQIQVWHRVLGADSWTRTVNLRGFPTVQWDVTRGCCLRDAVDKIGAYRGLATLPVSVWLGDFLTGTGFQRIAAAMPSHGA